MEETSNKALEFLNNKSLKIKEKEAELVSAEEDVRRMQALGLPIEKEKKALERLSDELYNIEFDISDINAEQKYMNAMIRDLRELNNVKVVTYGDAKKHKVKAMQDIDRVKKFIGDAENKIKGIKEETPEKDDLRKKILDSENYLGRLDSMVNSIDEKFADFIGVELEREKAVRANKDELQKLKNEKETFEKKVDEMYLSFSQAHKGAVDKKLNINALERDINTKVDINETYGASHAELYELGKKLEGLEKEKEEEDVSANDYRKQLEELNAQIERLNTQIEQKNREISSWEEEVSLLNSQIEVKNDKIEELESKLSVWKDSYNVFKDLVVDLAEYVNYPYNDFNGEEENENHQNPLQVLIERVQRITAFVEAQGMGDPTDDGDEVIVVKEDNSLKYIIGGVAIAALALSINK